MLQIQQVSFKEFHQIQLKKSVWSLIKHYKRHIKTIHLLKIYETYCLIKFFDITVHNLFAHDIIETCTLLSTIAQSTNELQQDPTLKEYFNPHVGMHTHCSEWCWSGFEWYTNLYSNIQFSGTTKTNNSLALLAKYFKWLCIQLMYLLL